MKKPKNFYKIFMALSLLCMVVGSCIIAASPDNILPASVLFGAALLLMLVSLVFIFQALAAQEKQKEERIKRLEDELARMKSTHR